MNKYFLYDCDSEEMQYFKTQEEYLLAVDKLKSNMTNGDGLPEENEVYNSVGGLILHQAVVVPSAFKKDVCTCDTAPGDNGDRECKWEYNHDFEYVGQIDFMPPEEAAKQREENRKNNVTEVKD